MRPVFIPDPPQVQNPDSELAQVVDWLMGALQEIAGASRDGDFGSICDEFKVSNASEATSLDPSTATASQVANVLAALIARGKKRGTAG